MINGLVHEKKKTTTSEIKISNILQSIDKGISDYYFDHLDDIEKNPEFGEQIHDFFYFRKQIEGYYQYHLFPKLDVYIIEDRALMGTFNRKKYIRQVIAALKQQKQNHSPWSLQEEQKTKQNPGADGGENQKDPQELKFIFLTWINLWCGTFEYQEVIE